ncbi:putative geraniol 8-hydroxylase [Medicago truncatula]|uniref:Cytochrome P450 family protein n=2 Tax=Medicago truncatula TaxID=3880 RepID=G7L1C9_MEDTR|nr:cytochrome P450 76T24 [Medicago truncatula]AES79998.1 cytochrome P450 family protein [Medicago truncatula]RHN46807.1 putative geraniol 8-hydroxylase [Medicago truncatula]
MDHQTLLLVISFVSATILIFILRKSNQTQNSTKLPPGPKPLPIIGNILELGKNPHKALTKLSKIYGPIMTLKLGSITTIVISSPQVAKQVLHDNSQIFSNRTVPHAISAVDHDKFSVGWVPTLNLWKKLRKSCATKVFSTKMLDSTRNLRQQKLQELLDYVNEKSNKGEVFDIGEAVFTNVLNSISNTLFSMDLAHSTVPDEKSQEFKTIIWGIMEEAGKPNISDFFPILRPLDPQGLYARMTNHMKKLCEIFDGIIEERIRSRSSKVVEVCNDVLDSLLNINIGEATSELSRSEMVHLFLDLFVAGIDTTSSIIEWIIAELLRNPDKLTKVRKELCQTIGKGETIEESHIFKLPFLQAVVKETFRLHPPIPLLLPHKCDELVNILGFNVPKNAQVLVNVWAMGRDPTIWKNPDMFAPERFLECDINYKGNNFELIPFGAGKRICPGLPLAHRTMHLMVASLLHNFEWNLADGLIPEQLNMDEQFGLTLKRVQPLRVQAISSA